MAGARQLTRPKLLTQIAWIILVELEMLLWFTCRASPFKPSLCIVFMSESGNFTIFFSRFSGVWMVTRLLLLTTRWATSPQVRYYSTVDELAVMFIQDSWIGFRTYETYVMIRALLSLIQNTCERVHSISSYTGLLGWIGRSIASTA